MGVAKRALLRKKPLGPTVDGERLLQTGRGRRIVRVGTINIPRGKWAMNFRNPDCRRVRVPSWGLVAGAVAAFGLLGSSGAMAQNCAPLTLKGNLFGGPKIVPGTIGAMASGLSGANAISGAVTAANTGFLTQSTAFVS